jgi:hypothetical protein
MAGCSRIFMLMPRDMYSSSKSEFFNWIEKTIILFHEMYLFSIWVSSSGTPCLAVCLTRGSRYPSMSLMVIGLSLPILKQRWRCLMFDVYGLLDDCCLRDSKYLEYKSSIRTEKNTLNNQTLNNRTLNNWILNNWTLNNQTLNRTNETAQIKVEQ